MSISFVGNLVADPEIRQTKDGKPWASFTLAHASRVKDQAGNWVDGKSTFVDCVMFEHGAGNLAGVLKGTRLMVQGKLDQQNWEKDGQKRSKLQIVVSEVAVSLKFGGVTFSKQGQGAPVGSFGGSGAGQGFSGPQNDGQDEWASGDSAPF